VIELLKVTARARVSARAAKMVKGLKGPDQEKFWDSLKSPGLVTLVPCATT
jgi:hypothetical protein